MPESINPATPQSGVCVLYAEDEDNDIFFLERALGIAGSPCTLHAVPDGQEAIDYLAGEGVFADRSRYPVPALVLLDINMPKKSGLEVLNWIRRQPHFKSLPVLVLTSSTRPEDMDNARRLGADDYLLKPADPLKLTELVKTLHGRWLPQPIAGAQDPASPSIVPQVSLAAAGHVTAPSPAGSAQRNAKRAPRDS